MYLGIDFGTCNSSAALLLDGTLKRIAEPLKHDYCFPSSVFVTAHGEILVGHAAENARQQDPQRYCHEFKRDLGSETPYTLGNCQMLPEELVSAVIRKLKVEADRVVQGRGMQLLSDAIITVPATYQAYKRNMMQEAGITAGFSQVKLLEEPVAAAIYYSRHAPVKEGEIILVYDLGGGTFDATLIQKKAVGYKILAMPKGLPHCGGKDFDREIYQHLKQQCSESLGRRLEDKKDWRTKAIVGDFCRQLKHQLSEAEEAQVYIPIGDGESYTLSRQVFNGIIEPLIDETIDCCDQLVRSAGLEWRQVNQVLLVGGSCRIPYVQEMVEEKFGRPHLLVDEPELAVCLGAAIGEGTSPPPPPDRIPLPVSIPEPVPISTTPNSVLTVSLDGTGDYRTISEAIKNAQPNAKIRVFPGTYQESLIIDKLLEIIGDGAVSSVIVQSTESACVSIYTDFAVVRHLTLQRLAGQQESESCAVNVSQGQLVLEDCEISSASLACISAHGPNADPIIRNCQIRDGKRSGIMFWANSRGVVEGCNIFNNEVAGIEIKQEANPHIRRCRIHDGKQDGIFVHEKGQGRIEDCEIFANVNLGVEIALEGKPIIRNCRIHDGKAGFSINTKGQGLIEDCESFANVFSGVEISQEGNPTLYNCRIHDNKQSGIMVCEKGQGTIEKCEIFANILSGVGISEESNPTFRDCQIHDNKEAGIRVSQKGQGLIEKCEIFANILSGVGIMEEGNPTFRDCQIHDNKEAGIGVIQKGQGLIENGEIFANSKSGVEIKEEGNPTIRNCQIHNGKALGILVWQKGKGVIESSEIFANSKSGVAIVLEGNPILRNCQIHDGKGCGIVVHNNGQGKVENCRIFSNALNPQTQKWICLHTLVGHGGFWGLISGVGSIAFSPDGQTIASGSDDETIKLWQSKTGKEIRTIKGHSNQVKAVAFSPNGRLLASGGSYNIKLLQVEDGREILIFQDRINEIFISAIFALAFSPDGQVLASGSNSDDKTIKLWQVNTGQEIRTLTGHSSGVRSVAFSPDGKILASGSNDNTIKLWQVSSGKEIRTLTGHSSGVRSVAFSPDGRVLASGSNDKTIKLWQVSTGQEIRTLTDFPHSDEVRSVAFSPDGQMLASGSNDKTIKLWQVSTGQEICTLIGHTNHVCSIAFSRDGTMLASGSDDKTIKIWQMTQL